MCGRFPITLSASELAQIIDQAFGLSFEASFDLPHYNVAPTQSVPAMIKANNGYRIGPLRWGLKHPKGHLMINTRLESILQGGMGLSSPLKRCVIFNSGFYEWDQEKQPYYVRPSAPGLYAFAGVYQKMADGTFGFSLITGPSSAPLSEIHVRQPWLLSLDDIKHYLDETIPLPSRFEGPPLTLHPVTKKVNQAHHNDARNLEPITLNRLV